MYEDFINNIKYLIILKINNVNEIVESHFTIFLTDKKVLKIR